MSLKGRIGSSGSFGAEADADDKFFVDDISAFDPKDVKAKDEEILDDDDVDQEQGVLRLKEGLDVR